MQPSVVVCALRRGGRRLEKEMIGGPCLSSSKEGGGEHPAKLGQPKAKEKERVI